MGCNLAKICTYVCRILPLLQLLPPCSEHSHLFRTPVDEGQELINGVLLWEIKNSMYNNDVYFKCLLVLLNIT